MDLEYYRGPLKGIHKLLGPISDFLKGDRNIEYLLNTYCLAQQQAMLENSIAWFRNCYNKEALADIGILPKMNRPGRNHENLDDAQHLTP